MNRLEAHMIELQRELDALIESAELLHAPYAVIRDLTRARNSIAAAISHMPERGREP
jgi:hypothetical protein